MGDGWFLQKGWSTAKEPIERSFSQGPAAKYLPFPEGERIIPPPARFRLFEMV
ncbi:hypothetical protein S1OALGB6SA_1634 [Olavius algarvensis spirochete endosymbiont]|nr:hypothetical protein S1OALGB6SA_1634 [Olavius algarvensis spirochete endosymbiont]